MNSSRTNLSKLETKPDESHKKSTSTSIKYVVYWISFSLIIIQTTTKTFAQSIGYHPNSFLGFNPYLSPVFGYGLGLPYGAYSYNSLNKPILPILKMTHGGGVNNWLSKLHAKSILKKLSSSSMYSYNGSIKNKLTLLKHPQFAYTPYGVDYGLGKHYGSALIPNNPYKSGYEDYYNSPTLDKKYASKDSLKNSYQHLDNFPQASSGNPESIKIYGIIKPLIKAGALITTAALLSKKTVDSPAIKLSPSGMIRDG